MNTYDPIVAAQACSVTRVEVFPGGATGRYWTEPFDRAGLLALLSTHVVAPDKYALAGIVAASRWEGPTSTTTGREAARGRDSFILPYDFDGADKRGVPLDRVHALADALRSIGVAFAITSSYSAHAKSAPGHVRIHVVLLAERLADDLAHGATWRRWRPWIESIIGSACDDGSVGERINAITYPPACPPGTVPLSIVGDGAAVPACEPTEADRTLTRVRAATAVDDREPRHPCPLAQRLDLFRGAVEGKRLPRRNETSGVLSGVRGMKQVRVIAFSGIAFGVPYDEILAHLQSRPVRAQWSDEEIEAACSSAWRYSDSVEWEGALPRATVPAASAAINAAPDRDAVAIDGPPGCGKTEAIIANTRDVPSLLFITPRTKQATDASTRAACALYADGADALPTTTRVATTAASARRYEERVWHTVVIDELATFLQEIDSAQYLAIQRICARATRVVVAGADITDELLSIARELTGRALTLLRFAARPLDRQLEIRHHHAVVNEILGGGLRDGCVFVGCDESVFAQSLAAQLRSMGCRVACFVGGGSGDVPTNETVRTHDFVIATHSMAEAISLTERVAKVYVVHRFRDVHRDTLLQLAARARNVADPVITIGERGWSPRFVDLESLGWRLVQAGGATDPYGPLRCRWLRERRQADARAFASMRWTTTYPIASVDTRAVRCVWSDVLDAHAIEIRERDAQRESTAPPCESIPVRPSPEQRAGYERARRGRYGLPNTPAIAKLDRGGKLRARIRRVALAAMDDGVRAAVCELLEPAHAADRKGLLLRARLDAEFLAAVEAGVDDWYAWARGRRRRLPTMPSPRARTRQRDGALLRDADRWADAWLRELTLPDGVTTNAWRRDVELRAAVREHLRAQTRSAEPRNV